MTYIVDDNCIKCKYMDCVDVCPVDCFYEGENMLVINPKECIDCGVCQPECPTKAILPQGKVPDDKRQYWIDFNQKYSDLWPNITTRRADDVPPDAKEWDGIENKMEHFSEAPGKGDEDES